MAVNSFSTDTEAEFIEIKEFCKKINVEAFLCTHLANGSTGTKELAQKVVQLSENSENNFKTLYEDSLPLWEKTNMIAQNIYGAQEIVASKEVQLQYKNFQESGYGHFPICMAKTQYSFSTDPNLKGAPTGHIVEIKELRLSAGAEFIVAVAGEIMTMPGLPKIPSANLIRLNSQNQIEGLF